MLSFLRTFFMVAVTTTLVLVFFETDEGQHLMDKAGTFLERHGLPNPRAEANVEKSPTPKAQTVAQAEPAPPRRPLAHAAERDDPRMIPATVHEPIVHYPSRHG